MTKIESLESSQESHFTKWNDKYEAKFVFLFSVAPQIRPEPQNGRLVVYQGEAATLGCDILKGSPTPEITWRRKVSFWL